MTSDDDPSGTIFAKLKLRSAKQTESSISLEWKRIAGASRYAAYGNKRGKANKLVRLATTRAHATCTPTPTTACTRGSR